LWTALGLSLLSAAAVLFFYLRGWLLYYGDAEAHLNIARRLIDSQTPGFDQMGTPWLPLPHLLMVPFVRVDAWWHSGIAASFSSAACFVIAGLFLFATARRVFDSMAAAAAGTALFALNPNLLYLQSTSMTESVFAACLLGLLYFSVRFRATQGWGSVAGAGIATCCGTLTRYDGWFLIPFAAAYFLFTARRRRIGVTILFCVLASAGAAWWLFYNWYLTGDALSFFRGPYSASAIQGNAYYPGKGSWSTAFLYFRTAAQLCAGPVLAVLALAGLVAALWKRAFWPVALLALPGIFYVWSLHSSGTPIFVPTLWPNSHYNTRYGLAVLPLLALAAGALVSAVPARGQAALAVLVVAAASVHWLIHPQPENWVTWAESRANSEGRRAWTHEAARYLAPLYVPGSGMITSSGDDFFGIVREMGIPLRETFSANNGLPFNATVTRPDLFLWQEWAVVKGGDEAQSGINRAGRYGIQYTLEKTIIEKDEPEIEIYRRTGGKRGTP
jgi:4-amino-4-deoxy-L-arabinose transferase-like glycosyltransferase